MKQLPKTPPERSMASVMAIPSNMEDVEDFEKLFSLLSNAPDFQVVDIRHDADINSSNLYITYKKEVYVIEVALYMYDFNEGNITHQLSEDNLEELKQADAGLKLSMLYTEDAQASYHLLLKVLCRLVPDLIGVYNCNSYSLLSPLWAQSAAASLTPPSPSYLYTIHAVSDDEQVWLHTHGLNCCGSPELEIVGLTQEVYGTYNSILSNLTENAISNGSLTKEKEGFNIGVLIDETPLIVTWVPWQEGLKKYKKDTLGGRKDRDEYHNGRTGLVFVYLTEEDYRKQKYSLVTEIGEKAMENPLFFITTKETDRMAALAFERIPFLKQGLEIEEAKAIVKIGLTVDDEFKDEDGSNKEHIWFEVNEMNLDSVTGTLIQNPYYVKSMHEGSTGTYPLSQITDWRLYINGMSILPDSTYLLTLLQS